MSIAKIADLISKAFNDAGSFKILSLQEDAFVKGQAFTHSDYTESVATSEVINYLFDPTNCDCSQVVAEVPIFNSTAGPVTIDYYVGGTVSANGTELFVFNRRSGSSEAKAKLYVSPTITSDGVKIAGQILTATAAVQGDTGATTEAGLPFEVDKTKLLIIRVTNNNGDGVGIGRRFDWIEA